MARIRDTIATRRGRTWDAGWCFACSSDTATSVSTTTPLNVRSDRLESEKWHWPLPGAGAKAKTLARAIAGIETSKMDGLDPPTSFADVLEHFNVHEINRLDEPLPWNWVPADLPAKTA